MSVIVTAPMVQVRMVDGSFTHVYREGVLPADVDPLHLDALLASGMVEQVDDDSDAMPAKSASRDTWADYATAQGIDVDADMTRDDIRGLFL